MQALPSFSWYVLLPDGLMLMAIAGLWVSWMRNAKRQRRLQGMLADTSRQLRQASCHLEEAMRAIQELNQAKKSGGHGHTSGQTTSLRNVSCSGSGHATVAQVLRMQREGHDEEEIAAQLNTPTAQVRLLLKLHAAGNRAHEDNGPEGGGET